MKERRNSPRVSVSQLVVQELNGDYMFSLKALNLSEEGIFIQNKFCSGEHEPFSKVSFTLPNGYKVNRAVARIIRENKSGTRLGSAFEFLKLSERDRLELKKFCLETEAKAASH